MKAKTKRRIKHLVTKKKLVSRKTSRSVLRTFLIGLATVSFGSLAYAITMTKPTINVAVHSSAPTGKQIAAPTPPPTPTPALTMTGRGSWYALGLPAPDALTCASRTYPRGSSIQVTNLRNGRTMVCTVNDYGPEAWTGRIIDLSRGSFRQLDDLGAGTIPVQLQLITGPTGLNLPLSTDYSAIVGYNLCRQTHTATFCDAHRQD